MAYLTGNGSLAEDLTQETFVSAWNKIDQFEGRAKLESWLHKIAYHKFIDSKRALDRQTKLINKLSMENQYKANKDFDPLYQLKADEHAHLLYIAMQKLSPSDYVVIVLHYIQSLSFRDTAKVLDEPIGTIKWRTSKALKKLRSYLTGGV